MINFRNLDRDIKRVEDHIVLNGGDLIPWNATLENILEAARFVKRMPDSGLFHKTLGDDFRIDYETRCKIWTFMTGNI